MTRVASILLLFCYIPTFRAIDPTNLPKYLKPKKISQSYHHKNIETYINELKASDYHKDYRVCQDLKKNQIYISTSKTHENGTTSSILYFVDDQMKSVERSHFFQTENGTIISKIFCSSGISILTMTDNRNVYAINHSNNDIFDFEIGKVFDVIFDGNIQKDVAILTNGNDEKESTYFLFLLDMINHRWVKISEKVIQAHWHGEILYYLFDKPSQPDLNSYDVDTGKKSIVASVVKNFGISNQILWYVSNKKGEISLIFNINSKPHLAIFGDVTVDDIIEVCIQNQIVLVTAMGEYNGFESIWFAELPELIFSKISSHILGFNQDNDFAWSLYGRIQFFAALVEGLTGIILVSYTVEGDDEGNIKHTVLSYNHGNSFLPLKFLTDDGMCEMHECRIFIPPTDDELSGSIKIAKNNPLVMGAQCILIHNGKQMMESLMISTDGGYSWRPTNPEFDNITILNEGEVMIGVNTKLHFSLDFGNTWTELLLNIESYSIEILLSGQESTKYKILSLIFSMELNDINVVVVDFSKIFDRKCMETDFKVHTPGMVERSSCFHGKEGFIYSRISSSICESIIKDLPKIIPKPCPCTPEDYFCPLEYNYYQGKCYIHSIKSEHTRPHVCNDPAEYVVSKIKPTKFKENICLEDPRIEEMEICRFHQNQLTITMLMKNKLTFVDIDRINIAPTIFLSDFQLIEKIKDFKFDKFKKCIFYHVQAGIIRKCYGNKREIAKPHLLIIRDITIIGIELDYMNHYLFYHNKHEITVVNVITLVKTTVYKTPHFIRFLKLDVSQQKMVISYLEKETRISKIAVLSISGTVEEAIFEFEKEIHEIIIYRFSLDILTNEGIYEYQTKSKQLKIIQYPIPNLKYLFVHYMKEYITNHGYVYGSYFVLMKNIQKANIELRPDPHKKQACRFSHCEFFCLSISTDSFLCACPDGMRLNKLTQKCIFEDSKQKINICRPNEHDCKNHQCIPQNYMCNGIDDCGDGSDELFCEIICNTDEIFCLVDRKCLKNGLICNGVNDCSDGVDEFECDKIIPRCGKNSFECLDERCIPKFKVCDGENDCGDWSDEKDCLDKRCEDFGAYCDDGTCLYTDQLCDDIFDCLDFSDERACNIRIFYHQNISCLITCDQRCLAFDKICDHLTDCQDAIDEKQCGFRPICPIIKPIHCDDGEGCYHESEKCDGFKDCSDGSDEKQCYETIPCFGNEMFTCGSGTRICMSKVCDGVTHCEDISDEKRHCGTERGMRHVDINIKDGGVVSFSWANQILVLSFDVYIHSMNKNIPVVSKQADKSEIEVRGHTECERYVLIVKRKRVVIRYRQYTYIQRPNYFTPYNLQYDRKSQIFSWQAKIPKCVEPIFYIECNRGVKLIYRNFSEVHFTKLVFEYPFNCKVSTCPKAVFNVSCSQFSKIGIDEIWGVKYRRIIIGISISLFLIMLFSMTMFFVYSKTSVKISVDGLKFKPLIGKTTNFKSRQSSDN